MSDTKTTDPHLATLPYAERQLVEQMHRRGASRREVVGYMMAAGATFAASGAIFDGVAHAAAHTPKRGGKLIMAADQHGPNDTLDPQLFTSSADYFRGRMFYGSLTRLTDTLGYEPELAEEVMSNADATVWTFKIRKGVEFHDGKTLTADDVMYSMNRHLGESSVSNASALVSMVDRWEKVNDYEVRAVLSSPNADLPIALGILAADGQIPEKKLKKCEFLGEMALNGELRNVRGVVPAAIRARDSKRTLVIPDVNAAEAALVGGGRQFAGRTLKEVCDWLDGIVPIRACRSRQKNKHPPMANS